MSGAGDDNEGKPAGFGSTGGVDARGRPLRNRKPRPATLLRAPVVEALHRAKIQAKQTRATKLRVVASR